MNKCKTCHVRNEVESDPNKVMLFKCILCSHFYMNGSECPDLSDNYVEAHHV